MRRLPLSLTAALLLAVLPGCSARRPAQSVMVPPRIDLTQLELIGVVEFDSTSRGKLGTLATSKFTEWSRRDQGVVRFVALGSRAEALRSTGRDRWDAETYKALGRAHGVRTILVGDLQVSNVRPDIRIAASLRSGQVSGQVDATLSVEMIEAATGASLWSASAGGSRNVGQISVLSGRNFSFDADDPERAYGSLVEGLVEEVTRDFRPTWEQR